MIENAFVGADLGGPEFKNWAFAQLVLPSGCAHMTAAITELGENLLREWKFF